MKAIEQQHTYHKFKECKGSVRYNSEDGILKSVYVQKDALPTPYPSSVKVTVEMEGE